jgi:hypothetical protein
MLNCRKILENFNIVLVRYRRGAFRLQLEQLLSGFEAETYDASAKKIGRKDWTWSLACTVQAVI